MRVLFSLVLFIVVMVGCKKETNNAVNNKPLLLITSVTVDANNPTDTLVKRDYEYDNTNRLIKIFKWASPGKKNLYLNFSYSTAGDMTSYILTTDGGPQNYILTFNNGLPVTETYSPAGFGASYIQNFQYSNNNNAVVVTNNVDTTARDTFTYNNNNLVRWSQRSNSDYLDNSVYTYGNHKGPYSSIKLKYFFSNIMPNVSANEVLTTTVTSIYPSAPPTTNISTGSSSYLYNAQGYPTKETDADQNSQPVSITYFYYKPGN